MLTKQQKKKSQLGGYELPARSTHSAAIERRSWEPWTDKENMIFFDSLSRNSRNWAEIARDVGTKRQEQVRTYYYRVLRRISKSLLSVNYNLDNRDRVATLVAMLAYWTVHTTMPTVEETTMEFAQALKDRILEQRAPPVAPAAPSRGSRVAAAEPASTTPAPEKVIIQLVPKTSDVSEAVAEAGFNPRLQLTFKAKRCISNIVDHVTKKWVHADGISVAKGAPIRLCTLGQSQVSGWDWGAEDAEQSILEIYNAMGCPPTIKLEYYWSSASSTEQEQEVEEVDDEDTEQKPVAKSEPFERTQFVHPLAQQFSAFDSHNIFEMDPVANQLSAMNLLADPFDEANSMSVDADAHFEPITADDDDDLMLGFDDQASTESMLTEEAASLDSPVAMAPEPVSVPAPVSHMPRVIFTCKPKTAPVVAAPSKPMTSLTSSINLVQPRAATPSPFPATPLALNMSYGPMSNGEGIIQTESFFNMDADPVFDADSTSEPSYGLDPLNSPSDDTGVFLSSSPQTPLRSKALKQHDRPLAILDGSDADDEEYCYAFNTYTTPKRPRMDVSPL